MAKPICPQKSPYVLTGEKKYMLGVHVENLKNNLFAMEVIKVLIFPQ